MEFERSTLIKINITININSILNHYKAHLVVTSRKQVLQVFQLWLSFVMFCSFSECLSITYSHELLTGSWFHSSCFYTLNKKEKKKNILSCMLHSLLLMPSRISLLLELYRRRSWIVFFTSIIVIFLFCLKHWLH